MRRAHSKLFGIFWTIFVLVAVALTFTIAFFLTAFLYRLIGQNPPALAVQLINSFLGLFLMALILSIFSRFFRVQQIKAFTPIIQALEKIAKGDFSIRLNEEYEDGILSGLVASVNKTASELGQMENMRQEFISNVSHEIQSPLTSIRGFAQAMENDQLSPEEQHHYLSIIENESTRLSRITEDLLKLAALESDHVKFEPTSYRLDKQIRNLVLACEPQWAAKQIDMEASLEEVGIIADEDLLSQVWINLINNSIKFTPPGGSVHIGLRQHDGQIKVKISDTGVGIAAEDQARVFERFYKADKSRTRSNGGSGLGLSIVKKIVDLHKGHIDLKSELG